MREALEGIRVLDFTRLLPGPYSTMLLGDFGAEVIKVEEPGRGDYYRWLEPMMGEYGASFQFLNRNKKSIALDLKNPRAREVVARLAQAADVLVEGFRPGVAQRLGIGYQAIKEANPRLIYCSITGFGPAGPYAGRPGHDLNYAALGGAVGLTGPTGQGPVIPSIQVADLGSALFAAVGILVALAAREHTGQGQRVDVAMLDSVVALLAGSAAYYLATGVSPCPGGIRLTGALPWYRLYEAQDGRYLAVGALERKFWEELCLGIGREDLIPCFDWPQEKHPGVIAQLDAHFRTRPLEDWIKTLERRDTCVSPVNRLDEVFSDPQVLHNEVVTQVKSLYGMLSLVNSPVKASGTPPRVKTRGPHLGEHTEEVLMKGGFSAQEVQELRSAGATGP
ncbi:MAG: CaiB/BaiF CoA-transferase family protein [Bacillota bacterium]